MILGSIKKFTVFLFLCIFGQVTIAQSTSYEGTYKVRHEAINAIFENTLILNADETFSFHSYTNHFNATPSEKDTYGKGTWRAKKNIISFFTDEENELDEKNTLNFSNTKARVDRKSIRNKSPEVIADKMRIYESNIAWVQGMKLEKVDL